MLRGPGGARLIADDIQFLQEYIDEHTEPGDNPLGGLVEKKVLQKWRTLKEHGWFCCTRSDSSSVLIFGQSKSSRLLIWAKLGYGKWVGGHYL